METRAIGQIISKLGVEKGVAFYSLFYGYKDRVAALLAIDNKIVLREIGKTNGYSVSCPLVG